MSAFSGRPRIKICGLTRTEDVHQAVRLGADALGLVFYPPSPRYVDVERAAHLVATVPPFVSMVGLFVNTNSEILRSTVARVPISILQFHGDESPERCAELAESVDRPFLRAYRIGAQTQPQDLLECETQYRQASRWFAGLLLDTYVEQYGGSGKVFDWSVIPKELAPRVVLSGGLNACNVTEALRQVRPYALDVSSGVEAAKGVKDPHKMHAFFSAAYRAADIPGEVPCT
jgi:phosphoribosylanthranilate isomerase